MNAIYKRRSVRKYKDLPVADAEIKKILKAAMNAPSAGNEQPWEFIVVKSRETMLAMTETNPYALMLKEAPAVIVICGNLTLQKFDYDFWIQDCSAAAQNLMVEAADLGIGSVWLGTYPIEERVQGLKQLLKLPKHVIPLAAIAIGYPEKEAPPKDIYLEERVHEETW